MNREDALRGLIGRYRCDPPAPFVEAPKKFPVLSPRSKSFLGETGQAKRAWIDGVCVRDGVGIAFSGHRALIFPTDAEDGLHREVWTEREHEFPEHRFFDKPAAVEMIPIRMGFLRSLAELALEKTPEDLSKGLVVIGPEFFAAVSPTGNACAAEWTMRLTSEHWSLKTRAVVGALYLREALAGASNIVLLGIETATAPIHIWRTDGERHLIAPRTDKVKK